MIKFTSGGTHALGVLLVDYIVGTKTRKTMFSWQMLSQHILCCWDMIGFM